MALLPHPADDRRALPQLRRVRTPPVERDPSHGCHRWGRIVRHEVHRGDEGARYYHPVAAWTTRDGRECEYASRFGRGSVGAAFRVGAAAVVRYDPKDPSRFEIQGWDVATVNLLFTVLGSVFTAGTLTVLLVRVLTL